MHKQVSQISLLPKSVQDLDLPVGSEILDVQSGPKPGDFYLFYEHDAASHQTHIRTIHIIASSERFFGEHKKYITTVVRGPYVMHFYEYVGPMLVAG